MISQTREVKVFIGPGLDEEKILEALNEGDEFGDESRKLFQVAHALLTGQTDDRAEIHEVDVTGVHIDSTYPNQVQIQFTTSWSMYFGCRDMDSAGEEDQDESVTYTSDGYLVFNVPEPRRPANEC